MPGRRAVAPALAAFVFLADQASKFCLEGSLVFREVIPGLLYLNPVRNPNLVFGLWRVPRLGVFALVVSAAVLFLTLDFRARQEAAGRLRRTDDLALGLVWGGMFGNLADRLLMAGVFDFVQLWFIPVFNLADAALTFGAALFIYGLVFSGRRA